MPCSLSRIPLNIFTENFHLNVKHAPQEPPELLAQAEPNSVKRLASGPRWDLNVKVCFKQKFNRSMMLKNQQHWLHDKKAKTSRFPLVAEQEREYNKRSLRLEQTVHEPRWLRQDSSTSSTCLSLLDSIRELHC